MALKPCKECDEYISTKAKACPHCGAPIHLGGGCGFLFIIMVVLIVIGLVSSHVLDDPPRPAPAPMTRQQLIDRDIGPAVGHVYLVQHIRARLHDPRSYRHDRTTWRNDPEDPNWIIVTTHYGAKNAFGAYVRGQVVARCKVGGSEVQILKWE